MAVGAMDMDAILPARTLKVLARMVQKSLDTAGYYTCFQRDQKKETRPEQLQDHIDFFVNFFSPLPYSVQFVEVDRSSGGP